MNFSVVICSRKKSTRLPEKPFIKFSGRAAISHLCERLAQAKLPIILAVPSAEVGDYYDNLGLAQSGVLRGADIAILGSDYEDDPLMRMAHVARSEELDFVIRVTHDKIFIDTKNLLLAIKEFIDGGADYLFSSHLTDGTGFEIVSTALLEKASAKYKKVEHISYAVRALSEKSINYVPPERCPDARLLLDYPEDQQFLDLIFTMCGADCSLTEVLNYLDAKPWHKNINRLPVISVYTCVQNGEDHIRECINSVLNQQLPVPFEYIVIDDFSTDKTPEHVALFSNELRWHRNSRNLGLSSSSNVALSHARGKYIVRIDADDYFVDQTALGRLLSAITMGDRDAVYPNNYYGAFNVVQKGWEQNHIGGAMFRKSALEFLKFKEGLRAYEGLELFSRAQAALNIGYLDDAVFFYRQHDKSMSKTNTKERAEIKSKILRGDFH